MNKKDLINVLHDEMPLTKKDAEYVIDLIVDAIEKSLCAGEDASLHGFGTFKVVQRKARTARNPITGATVDVPASKAVVFKPSKTLKDKVNA